MFHMLMMKKDIISNAKILGKITQLFKNTIKGL